MPPADEPRTPDTTTPAGPTAPGPAGVHARIEAPVATFVQLGTFAVPLRPRRPRPAELPPRPRRFVGREREANLVAHAAGGSGDVRAVLLGGRPGAGKSALAVESAHRIGGLFPDGVVFAELGAADGRGPSAHELTGRLLRSLGARVPDRAGDRAVAWRRLLRERRVLVVLDDVQRAAQVTAVLPEGPDRAFAVLTARSGLLTLPVPLLRLRLGDLDVPSSRALLGHAEPAGDPAVLDELVGLCAGLPLALRIVAARLAGEPGLTPARLAAQLRRRTIDELRAGDRAVRASFEASHAGLGEPERRMFRRLAAVPLRDVTVPGAAALAGVAPERAAELLATLYDAQLLDRRPGRVPRHRMHDLLRRYGEEKLRARGPGEAAAAAERLVGHYRRALDRALQDPRRSWFAEEWDNLVALAAHLAETGTPWSRGALDHLADAVAPQYDPHASKDGWIRIQGLALAAAADGPAGRRAELRVRISAASRGSGRPDRAPAVAPGTRERHPETDLPVEAVVALRAGAEVLRATGDLDGAAGGYRDAIAALRRLPPGAAVTEALAWALHALGNVECLRGDPWSALGRQRAALRRFGEAGSRPGRAWAWHGIGDARRGAGDADGAAEAYRTALDLHDEPGGVARSGWTRQCLGELLASQGRPREAAAEFELARRAAVLRSDAGAEARARRWLAVTSSGPDGPGAGGAAPEPGRGAAQLRPRRSPAGP
ncbi:tetratricopeptide repeat protein [Pseudonocardia sp.]|uniref:tetratricopeptide repeat protein n=1 Tax=Pseudonocardia sp. TaxID=60912 RepID=UPI0031FBE460